MIDINDLQSLEICKKCNKVFMPEFEEGSDYARTPFAKETDYCKRCVKSMGGEKK